MAYENVTNKFIQANSGSANDVELNGNVYSNKALLETTVTATLAEINAGKTLIPAIAGRTIKVKDYLAKVSGTFATGTSIEIEDSNGTPVVVTSIATAGLTNGAVLAPTSANTTVGAGLLDSLTEGASLDVTKTGSAFTGGTSITFSIKYLYV